MDVNEGLRENTLAVSQVDNLVRRHSHIGSKRILDDIFSVHGASQIVEYGVHSRPSTTRPARHSCSFEDLSEQNLKKTSLGAFRWATLGCGEL